MLKGPGGLNGVCWDKWDFRDVIVAVWDLRQGLQWKARSRALVWVGKWDF